jgi:hypothetical protein
MLIGARDNPPSVTECATDAAGGRPGTWSTRSETRDRAQGANGRKVGDEVRFGTALISDLLGLAGKAHRINPNFSRNSELTEGHHVSKYEKELE